MILNAIIGAFKSLFYILIIESLTPYHVISMPTFYLFFIQIALGINVIIKNKSKIKENMVNIILEVMTCLSGLIAFSIF